MSVDTKKYEEWEKQRSKKIEVSDVTGPIRVGPPPIEETPRFRPAAWPASKENFQNNLEKYRQLALSLGAVDAKIVSTKDIPQDLRAVWIGCTYPLCRWLNTNTNCPLTLTFPFDEMVKFVTDYNFAIVYKVPPPVIDDVPDVGTIDLDMYYTMGGLEKPDKTMLARNIVRLRILGEMTRRVRAAAFYDGYLTSTPIGSGPCLVEKCADIRQCSALKKGGHCRFVDVQPAGQVVYIDYHKLGRSLGWGELQVGGNCAFPEDVPDPSGYYNIGMVLVD